MYEEALLAIQRYIDEYLFEPPIYWSKRDFSKQVYSRWAAFELMERIMDRPFDQPDMIIEHFLIEMVMYAHMEEKPKKRRIFLIAKDTAEDILHLF